MEQEPTVEVPMEDYFAAINRWVDFWDRYALLNRHNEFDRFLENGVLSAAYTSDKGALIITTPEAAHKIQLLNGPHHHTILKAYRIQRGKHD